MTRATAIVTLLLCAPAAPAEPVPEGVTISKWVREDLFAGFLGDSMDEFNRGVAKLDEILTGAPDNGTAVVWRASVDLYLAVNPSPFKSLALAGSAVSFKSLYRPRLPLPSSPPLPLGSRAVQHSDIATVVCRGVQRRSTCSSRPP